jgi:RHS repeat-associated protein
VLAISTPTRNRARGNEAKVRCQISRATATFYRDFGNPNVQRVVVETPPAAQGGGNQFQARHFDGLGRSFMTLGKGPSPAQMIATLTTYNARGGVASATAPYYLGDPSYATTYSYDALDRLTTLRHPDNHTIGKSYGLWTETTTDENGTPFTVHLDAYGRVKVEEQVLDDDPVLTSFTYDSLGRLTRITDALDNVWSWEFDTLGRAEQRTHPDTGTWTFVYDDADRVTRQTDAKNQRVELAYDVAGQVASRSTYDQSGSLTETMTYVYSEERDEFFNVGRLTSVNGPGSTVLQHNYDARGRLVHQRRSLDGTDYTSQVVFDAGDRPVSVQYPDQEWIGPLTYDQAGRLKAIPNLLNDVLWDASGRATRQINFNTTVTERTFSPERGLLKRIRTTVGQDGATIQDLQYGHKPNGIVESVASPHTDESWTYGYDDLYRLNTAANLSTPTNSQSWSHDAIGRITSNSRVGDYSYPSPGSARPHAPTTAGPHAFTYDPNGNLLAGAGRSLSWNVDNLLVSANAVQFTYDADGERLKVTRGTSVSRYPFGDDYEITNGVVTKYFQIDGLGLIAKKVTGDGAYWLHTDAQGSVQAITALSGAEVQRRTYRPYGEKIADTTAHLESRGWIDQRQDDETGLTYLHARYYDPELGVFISSDPIGAQGGLNSYLYSTGDPINLSDPSGLLAGLDDEDGVAVTLTTDLTGGAPTHDEDGGMQLSPLAAIPLGCMLFCGGSPQPGGTHGPPGQTIPPAPTPVPMPAPVPDPPIPGPDPGGPGHRPRPPRVFPGPALSPFAQQVIAGVNQYNLDENFGKLATISVALGTGYGAVKVVGGVAVAQVSIAAAPAAPQAQRIATGGAGVVRIGQIGEASVRAAYNIGRRGTFEVAGRRRIADGMTATTLSEVKNVRVLSYTQQLRDYVTYASATNRTVHLYTRPDTRLSRPLWEAIRNGLMVLRYIP